MSRWTFPIAVTILKTHVAIYTLEPAKTGQLLNPTVNHFFKVSQRTLLPDEPVMVVVNSFPCMFPISK
jgi:hypothetical protein